MNGDERDAQQVRAALVTRVLRIFAATIASAFAFSTSGAFSDAAPAVAAARAAGVAVRQDGFAIATAPYRYAWPRDQAAHPDYQTEWWYFTGHVTAKDGRRFGYELTFFRIGLRPGDPKPAAGQSRWRGHELYPAHFAITDERGKTFFHDQVFAREALGMGDSSAKALAVNAQTWTLHGEPGSASDRERMVMHASEATDDGENALDFVQTPQKSPAIHGHGGVSKKAACASCASHYYSYTRLKTTGTLVFHGERFAIDGLSWMDHEFGSGELQRNQAGWDWFSLQLDDDRDVMLYRLRQKDGSVTPQSSGSLVAPNGGVRYLPLDAFAIEATGSWTSPHTHGVYPSGWRVTIPAGKLHLVLTPTLLDQELPDTSTGVSYWEGAVDVKDATSGKIVGVGYVELTGYAGQISF